MKQSQTRFGDMKTKVDTLNRERDAAVAERDAALAEQTSATAQSQKVAMLTRQIEVASNEKNKLKLAFEQQQKDLEAGFAAEKARLLESATATQGPPIVVDGAELVRYKNTTQSLC